MGSTSRQRTSVRPPRHGAGANTYGPGRRVTGVGGDPSPWTARGGVFLSMELAAHRRLHRPLSDCTIAIQGVGHVGVALVQMLHQAGAQLLVSDVNAAAAALTRHVCRELPAIACAALPSQKLGQEATQRGAEPRELLGVSRLSSLVTSESLSNSSGRHFAPPAGQLKRVYRAAQSRKPSASG